MFQKLLKNISFELTKNEIPYMVIGGQAVLIYGEPRLTKDIDITLGVGPEQIEKIQLVIARLGLRLLVKEPTDFVKETMVLPVIEGKSGIRIDFIFSLTPYERGAIQRAKRVNMTGSLIKFASLEDLIIHKLIAGRERDIEDVKSIILKNPNYDTKYITKWLKDFDMTLDGEYLQLFNKIKKQCR